MSTIAGIATALPAHRVGRGDMDLIAERWLTADPAARDKLLRLVRSAGVESRYFALPADAILSFNGMRHRAECFARHGTPLLHTAVAAALAAAPVDPAEIEHFVFTSCSAPLIPSIDAAVVFRAGLRSEVRRVPIYQQGCAGGVVSLGLAARLAASGRPALFASLELCSVVFQPQNHSGSQLVGAAIFGDGAAAGVVLSEGPGIRIVDSCSALLPESMHLMGYDVFDDGFHLRLDRSLPQVLVEHAPSIVGRFLQRNGLRSDDIRHWLFHPGGVRILDYFDEAFELSPTQSTWSREVLRDVGNLSSATVHFVLKRFLESGEAKAGERALMVGVGPGLTVEAVLFETPGEAR